MKLLTLIRHGKSSWNDNSLSDHDRPLLDKGKKRTQKIAKYLKENSVIVDLIISSSAVRALETAKIIASGINYKLNNIKVSKQLYHASENDIYNELYAVDNKIDSVVLFGHNPTFTDFVNDYLDEQIYNLPTSGSVAIKFNTYKWEEILNAKYSVEFIALPKNLNV